MTRISVVIPTFERPVSLTHCLDGLARQTRPADEVLIAVRDDDPATAALLRTEGPGRVDPILVPVGRANASEARNLCLQRATGTIIAMTDDDTVPRPDWLATIEARFRTDPALGGLGGPDWQAGREAPMDQRPSRVGVLQWFGRKIGNHHLGSRRPLDVDWLKGANMSFRRDALPGAPFGRGLRGTAAQYAEDFAVSVAVGLRGWRLRYDPDVAVDHFPARIRDGLDHRDLLDERSLADAAFNDTVATLACLPPLRRIVFLIWAGLAGTRQMPGFVLAGGLAAARASRDPLRRAAIVATARLEALRTWRQPTGTVPAATETAIHGGC